MKKILLTMTLALLSFFAYSQQIVINGVDKFNGNKIIQTSAVKTTSKKNSINYCLQSVNGSCFLLADITTLMRTENDVLSIILLLDGEEKIALEGNVTYANSKEVSSSIHWGAGISTGRAKNKSNLLASFPIDLEIIKRLSSAKVSAIRVMLGQPVDFELVRPYSPARDAFPRMFGIFLQEIPK